MSDARVTAAEDYYRKVEELRKKFPLFRTSALIELANVSVQSYYRGRRAVLDAKTPSKGKPGNEAG